MATLLPVVKRWQPPVDDDTALLANGLGAQSDGARPSALSAHRRRLAALFRLAWDSGAACVCGAALVFSFAALFVKFIGSAIPVFQIVAFRSVISFTICLAYARAAGIKPLFGHRANLRFLISRGIFGAAAMTTYYFSIKMLPLADAVTLFFLNPAITAVAAWAIMKEPLGFRGVGGVLISLCGLVLLTRPRFLFGHQDGGTGGGLHGEAGIGVDTAGAADSPAAGGEKQRLLGSMFGLLSAVLSAGAFISIRYIGKSEPALVVSVYFHVCAAASSIVPLAAGLPAPAVWPSGAEWALLLGVACCSFWGQILIGRGFQLMNAARASAINLTQVVYSYLLGLIFLHEQLTPLGAGGSVLIAIGAVLVNLRPKAPPPAAAPPAAIAVEAEAAGRVAAAAEDVPEDGTKKDAPATANSSDYTAADCCASYRRPGVAAVVASPTGAVELAGVRAQNEDGGNGGKDGDRGRYVYGGFPGPKAAEAGVDLERRPLLLSPAGLAGQWDGGAEGDPEEEAVSRDKDGVDVPALRPRAFEEPGQGWPRGGVGVPQAHVDKNRLASISTTHEQHQHQQQQEEQQQDDSCQERCGSRGDLQQLQLQLQLQPDPDGAYSASNAGGRAGISGGHLTKPKAVGEGLNQTGRGLACGGFVWAMAGQWGATDTTAVAGGGYQEPSSSNSSSGLGMGPSRIGSRDARCNELEE